MFTLFAKGQFSDTIDMGRKCPETNPGKSFKMVKVDDGSFGSDGKKMKFLENI